jgi:hypothetical protein
MKFLLTSADGTVEVVSEGNWRHFAVQDALGRVFVMTG